MFALSAVSKRLQISRVNNIGNVFELRGVAFRLAPPDGGLPVSLSYRFGAIGRNMLQWPADNYNFATLAMPLNLTLAGMGDYGRPRESKIVGYQPICRPHFPMRLLYSSLACRPILHRLATVHKAEDDM